MTGRYPFDPDWVCCPGEVLQEWFEETGAPARIFHADPVATLTEAQLARLLVGEEPLTLEIANVLAYHTHVPEAFWLTLEHNYRAGLDRGCVHPHD